MPVRAGCMSSISMAPLKARRPTKKSSDKLRALPDLKVQVGGGFRSIATIEKFIQCAGFPGSAGHQRGETIPNSPAKL
jgi:hypothetical protein